ncbi:MAG: 50S ribosome-binding GTPase [Rickettsiales bacterium]|jgi:tRNA modification GTPase|nr:50S ribosome-binding GTPase [Rickettsiales bacterium]
MDRLIEIWFPAPSSFTGENVVELHCHGGLAVIKAVFAKLQSFGFRMAERGEFARRAFENGKMDLTEVEGMGALISAQTERQRVRALMAMSGGDSAAYQKWRDDLVSLSALAAARMDYSADELPQNVNEQIAARRESLIAGLRAALASKTHRIEAGYDVVLAGPVNSGKSSLFNALIGESRALVSPVEGTTRDAITAELDIGGYLVRLIDTAGLRESDDEVERMGIEKARDYIESADLVLRLSDAEIHVVPYEIAVVSKTDLLVEKKRQSGAIYVSAETGEGLGELLAAIEKKIHEDLENSDGDVSVSARTRGHIEAAMSHLEKSNGKNADTEAEHIGRAAYEIGLILGIIGSDEIYASVFSQLCLGK